jgi:hypothetical protein
MVLPGNMNVNGHSVGRIWDELKHSVGSSIKRRDENRAHASLRRVAMVPTQCRDASSRPITPEVDMHLAGGVARLGFAPGRDL